MTTTFATPYSGYNSTPVQLPTAQQGYAAKLLVFRAQITLAAQASGDVIKLMRLPKGILPLFGLLTSTVSLGTSTLAIGNATTAGKYRAAGVFTATDTPTPFGVAANLGVVPLANDEEVLATIGTAALPGSGTAFVDMVCASL